MVYHSVILANRSAWLRHNHTTHTHSQHPITRFYIDNLFHSISLLAIFDQNKFILCWHPIRFWFSGGIRANCIYIGNRVVSDIYVCVIIVWTITLKVSQFDKFDFPLKTNTYNFRNIPLYFLSSGVRTTNGSALCGSVRLVKVCGNCGITSKVNKKWCSVLDVKPHWSWNFCHWLVRSNVCKEIFLAIPMTSLFWHT
jgi:hypothetical protein